MFEYNKLEKMIIIMFNLIAFVTFIMLSNLLQSVVIGAFIFLLFGFVNMAIPEDKRLHASSLIHCFILSNLYLFLCLFVFNFSLNYNGYIESVCLVILLILSASLFTSNILWWKGKNSNYSDIDEFIRFNEFDDKMIEFEDKLKEKDNLLYLLYKYRFKDNYTFNEISEKTGLENPRIAEKLDKIAFSLRIYCGI